MGESLEIIKNSLVAYIGSGWHIILYIFSIIYLIIKEKDKKKKVFLIYFQLIILFVILNPIFNKIVGKIFTSRTYVRMFWCVPYGITISYMFVNLFYSIKNEVVNKIVLILSIIIICITGKLIYLDGNFIKVDNIYKLPDEHVLIAQLIGVDEEEYKKALVPETMCAHIRQIEPSIKLAYKREPTGYENNKYVIALNSGNTEEITKLASEEECNYIVMKKETVLWIDFTYFGFEKMNETENYVIYKKV